MIKTAGIQGNWYFIPLSVIIGRSCHKYHFCRGRNLSQQTRVCRNKTSFVTIKVCLLWQKFGRENNCRDKIFLSRQNLSQQIFVVTNIILLWQTCVHMLVETKLLSWQTCVCCDKSCVATDIILSWQKFCHSKHNFVVTKDMFCCDKHMFVMTKDLSQQRWYLWQLPPVIVCDLDRSLWWQGQNEAACCIFLGVFHVWSCSDFDVLVSAHVLTCTCIYTGATMYLCVDPQVMHLTNIPIFVHVLSCTCICVCITACLYFVHVIPCTCICACTTMYLYYHVPALVYVPVLSCICIYACIFVLPVLVSAHITPCTCICAWNTMYLYLCM